MELYVSYTDDDLQVASECASNLSIAYWNDEAKQWNYVRSKVKEDTLLFETTKVGEFISIAEPDAPCVIDKYY